MRGLIFIVTVTLVIATQAFVDGGVKADLKRAITVLEDYETHIADLSGAWHFINFTCSDWDILSDKTNSISSLLQTLKKVDKETEEEGNAHQCVETTFSKFTIPEFLNSVTSLSSLLEGHNKTVAECKGKNQLPCWVKKQILFQDKLWCTVSLVLKDFSANADAQKTLEACIPAA